MDHIGADQAPAMVQNIRLYGRQNRAVGLSRHQCCSEGADENAADDFLKENIQVYQQKIGLMNKMEPINNDIIIVSTPDTEEYSDVMLSIVADEALTIRGVKCSFSIGRVNRNTIK